MQNKQGKQGRAMSITGGVTRGMFWALLITFASIAILAKMVDKEILPWESVGYGIMLTLIISAFVGSKVAVNKVKRRKLLVCVVSGIIYFCTLLIITALFFGGKYYAIGESALLLICGSALAVLTELNTRQTKSRKKSFRNQIPR